MERGNMASDLLATLKPDDEYLKMAQKYFDRSEWRYKFAGMALQGFAKGYRSVTAFTPEGNVAKCIKLDCKVAVAMADALLDELEGKS